MRPRSSPPPHPHSLALLRLLFSDGVWAVRGWVLSAGRTARAVRSHHPTAPLSTTTATVPFVRDPVANPAPWLPWRVQGASGVAVSLVSPDELALAEGIMQHQEDAATAQSTGNPVRSLRSSAMVFDRDF